MTLSPDCWYANPITHERCALPLGHSRHHYYWNARRLRMTHSGGQEHAVGDRGQRYEVTVFDENAGKRIVVGWTDDVAVARQMADSAEKRPSWNFPWVTDRRAVSETA